MDEKDCHDPALSAEIDRQLEIIKRGSVDLIDEEGLRRRLARSIRSGRGLRVKLGVDPTAHDLHLGFTLPLNRLRAFSDLGHTPVLIIGDATAMVGDPTGKNRARPQLSREMVDDYAASYLEQAALVLDMDRVEVRRNSEWLHALGFTGLIALAAKATVAQILQRDDFQKRYASGSPIHLHEFIYPLMQAWDSVVVKADVELGGQDQLFNLLLGRDLQKLEGQEEQACLLTPLLVGLDGTRKMSKSFGNAIGIREKPEEMFGKLMSIPDALMRDYWLHLTQDDPVDIDRALNGGTHPRDLKDLLARKIVSRFWGSAAADAASGHFRRVISEKQEPDDMPELALADYLEEGRIGLIRLIVLAGFAQTNGEARRLIKQGGVKLDGTAIQNERFLVEPKTGQVLKVGKRRYVRLIL